MCPHVCAHVYVCSCVFRVHVSVCMHMCVPVGMCVSACVRICVHMYVCLCVGGVRGTGAKSGAGGLIRQQRSSPTPPSSSPCPAGEVRARPPAGGRPPWGHVEACGGRAGTHPCPCTKARTGRVGAQDLECGRERGPLCGSLCRNNEGKEAPMAGPCLIKGNLFSALQRSPSACCC